MQPSIKLIIASTLLLVVVHCTLLVSGSGDEFMSCDRYFENKRESRLLKKIPCDMSKTLYCKQKGPAYPEAAIWRFKEENRALMRRMYGDMESNSVYRQMRSSMSTSSLFEEHHSHEETSSAFGGGFMPDIFSSLEYNIRVGSGLATVQSAKEPVVDRVKIKVKRKIVKTKPSEEQPRVKVETSTTSSTSSVFATTSESPSPVTTTANSFYEESTKMPNPTTTMGNSPMTTQSLDDVTMTEADDTTTDLPMEGKDGGIPLSQLLADVMNGSNAGVTMAEEQTTEAATDEEEYFEEYEEEESEEMEELAYSGESINACPVKEEVFAPYWANNTRDQVLALLNLYPFEQYIHMETCKYEFEEMLCRKGCRCEQQYRLHRLLAFDPNNECRGIFSDWFRFPSYCICKCYNVGDEFLAKHHRKPKIDYSSVNEEVSIDHSAEDDKDNNGDTVKNIPALLPYEAKQALLLEMARKDRKMPMEDMNAAVEALEEVEEAADHFFYGNSPVLGFNLANGNSGSVGQTPRKK